MTNYNEQSKGESMTDLEILKEVKKLSNGKFGKEIVISGDAQIVLMKLMNIYVLVTNHLACRDKGEK